MSTIGRSPEISKGAGYWLMQKLLLIFFGTCLILAFSLARPGMPQSPIAVPYESMPDYAAYRGELLSKGWQPITNNPSISSGGFSELVCGNRVCSADWVHNSGQRTISILIWPDGDVYRVAPAIE